MSSSAKQITDTKQRQYKNHDINIWKTNDKQWVKDRKADWPSILIILNHLHSLGINGMDVLRHKSDYKYIKQYYLTGFINYPKEKNGISWISNILSMISPIDIVDIDSSLLLECWLTPEPSTEKWNHIIDRYESSFDTESRKYGHISPLEKNKLIYRTALLEWYEGPEKGNLFGELEPILSSFFQPFPDSKDYDFYSELMGGFLLACGWGNSESKYNPNHPVYNYSQQIVDSIIPMYFSWLELTIKHKQKSERKFKYYSEKNLVNYSNKFAFLIYITINSKNYGSKQVTLAKGILKGIGKLDLPENLVECLEIARINSENEELMKKIIKQGTFTIHRTLG